MLDLKAIRRDPDAVRAALARRKDGSDERLGEALALDAEWRELTAATETLRAELNAQSAEIAAGKKAGQDVGDAIVRTRELSARVKETAERLRAVEERRGELLASVPNPPDPTAADEDTT